METPENFIYFTAQFYSRSKVKADTLDEKGFYGLWRIRPDGSGLRFVKKGKRRAITTELVSIRGGYWQ